MTWSAWRLPGGDGRLSPSVLLILVVLGAVGVILRERDLGPHLGISLATVRTKTDEELKSIAPANIAAVKRTADVGLGIMHDHYRLEAGLSTSNLATISADIAELQRMDKSGKSVHNPVDK